MNIVSSKTTKISTVSSTTNIYTEKKSGKSWTLHHIPLSNTWVDGSNRDLQNKYPDIDVRQLPRYESQIHHLDDYKLSKTLRRVNRQDFTPITFSNLSDLDQVVSYANEPETCLKHSHLISWDYEIDVDNQTKNRKGLVAYRSGRFLKGADVVMVDCDHTIPFQEFKDRFRNYRWFSRTSYGNINEKQKFHAFFLLDEYQNADKIREITSKLATVTFQDKQVFDPSVFNFGIMLAGHAREEMSVFWNDGKCITEYCEGIELPEETKKKISNKSKRTYSVDTSGVSEGLFKRRIEYAKQKGFLLYTTDRYAKLRGKDEKTEGGYTLWSNGPDWVRYEGAREGIPKNSKWDRWLENNGYSDIEPYYDLSNLLGVDEAVKKLTDLMCKQVLGNHIYKVTAGLGKTECAIRNLVYRLKSRLITGEDVREKTLIFVPSHQLAKEMKTRVKEIHKGVDVRIIKGRTGNDISLCLKSNYDASFKKLVEEVGKEGYGTFGTFCYKKTSNGVKKCSYWEDCPYIKQYITPPPKDADKKPLPKLKDADVVIMTHNHLTLPPVEMLDKHMPEFDRIIIDEGFYGSMCYSRKIERERLMSYYSTYAKPNEKKFIAALRKCEPDLDGNTLPILKVLRDDEIDLDAVLEEHRSHHYFNKEGIDPTLGDHKTGYVVINQALEEYKNNVLRLDDFIETLQKELKYDRVDSNALVIVQEEKRTRKKNIETVKKGKIYYTLHSKKPILDKYKNLPITYLDASAPSQELIENLTGMVFNRHEILCEDQAHYYYEQQKYPKLNTIFNDRDNPETRKEKKQRIKDIQSIARKLTGSMFGRAEGSYKVLLCSYKDYIKEHLTEEIPSVKKVYFQQGLRGVDDLKDCDVAYVVGRQEPPPVDVEKTARSIYSDTPYSLDTYSRYEWYEEENRGMETTDGKVIRVMTSRHKDVRVNEVLELIREEEIIQVIARLRSVRLKGKRVIFSGKVCLPVRITAQVTQNKMLFTGLIDIFSKFRAKQDIKIMSLAPETIIKYNKEAYKGYPNTLTEKIVRDDKKRFLKYLSYIEGGTDKKLPELLHLQFGCGHYKYKEKTGITGEGKDLITFLKDEKKIKEEIAKLYGVDVDNITLTCKIPADRDFLLLKKSAPDWKERIVKYIEWIGEEDKNLPEWEKEVFDEDLPPP